MKTDLNELLLENARLRAELESVPHWVPIEQWVRDSNCHIVSVDYGPPVDGDDWHYAEAWPLESGEWISKRNAQKLVVTHVLVGLKPPNNGSCPECGGLRLVKNTGIIAVGKALAPCRTCIAGPGDPLPDCCDMFGRGVTVNDMMWDTSRKRFFRAFYTAGGFLRSVLIPRPGETVHDFPGWDKMCEAVQEDGVVFNYTTGDGFWSAYKSKWIFSDNAEQYRRCPSCKWAASLTYWP